MRLPALSLLRTLLLALIRPILILLRFLLTVLLTVSAPVLHVGFYMAHGAAWPVRVLAKLETLYIFFGVAALVGVVAGAGLHFGFGVLVAALRHESRRERTVVRERRGRGKEGMRGRGEDGMKGRGGEEMRDRVEGAYRRVGGFDGYGERKRGKGDGRGRGRRGVMTSTILEEESSSEVGF